MTIGRIQIHAEVVINPKTAVLEVFGVTQSSHFLKIERAFRECAALTGCTCQIVKASQEFKNAGNVPDFVLQCCSARLFRAKNTAST